MTLPNFIIIGAPKSGTTSLNRYLQEHPEIFMSSLKESHFFSSDRCKNSEALSEFKSLFQNVGNEKAIGEACAGYIFKPEAPARMKALIPHAKLVAILRDPAERAYSEYLMRYRSGTLNVDLNTQDIESGFWEFMQTENKDKLYFQSISQYLQEFDRGQLHICLFEDLKHEQTRLLKDVCKFLGVDETLISASDNKVYNKGGVPKNQIVFSFLESLRYSSRRRLSKILPENIYSRIRSTYSKVRDINMQTEVAPLSKDSRQKVIDMHREDILQLQDYLKRDLSAWLC